MGEVSITLDDVASLLHLPIVGAFHTFEPLHVDEVMLMLVELLEVSGEAPRAETAQYALRDLSQSGSYAWAVVVLVHMYDHLNDACRSSSQQLASYITLLQCWIYKHFPSVAECMVDSDYDELRWGPIAVRNRPERIMRQFGYVQSIPIEAVNSWVSFEEIDDRWVHYSYHLAPAGEICLMPDPPRHPPATHDASFMEPHIPQVPEPPAAPTHVCSDVDKPRHAVDVCHVIAERLEHLLNLRIVT
ncbi:hypothetical protein GmHk_15G043887 [Glycine max]|nr:hypothetical protein GmHk_15G043887 [Glycine max]